MAEEHVYQFGDKYFYLPDADVDCIQGCIVGGRNYWDIAAHNIIDKYLEDDSIIMDIGANIGSHTVYWAKERNAYKVYSFEPFKRVFDILKRNVELNSLQDKVTIFNSGCSDEEVHANPGSVHECNLGGTSFVKDSSGVALLKPLDSYGITDYIDLIKIDVEGAEVEVLKGAMETLIDCKPVLVIESFHRKDEVESVIFPLGYKLVDTIREGEDYIYMCD